MTHKKPHLPEKICPVCQRSFAWRKKWERDWPQVKYCSERCKRQGKKPSVLAWYSQAQNSIIGLIVEIHPFSIIFADTSSKKRKFHSVYWLSMLS